MCRDWARRSAPASPSRPVRTAAASGQAAEAERGRRRLAAVRLESAAVDLPLVSIHHQRGAAGPAPAAEAGMGMLGLPQLVLPLFPEQRSQFEISPLQRPARHGYFGCC